MSVKEDDEVLLSGKVDLILFFEKDVNNEKDSAKVDEAT